MVLLLLNELPPHPNKGWTRYRSIHLGLELIMYLAKFYLLELYNGFG